MASNPNQDVMIIAIGGPTCSGKTTLAKNLRNILPNAEILHQDDFAPKSEEIPIHPIHGVPDWDDPRGAIDWDRFRNTIQKLKMNKDENLPKSHDDLNITIDPIELESKKFNKLSEKLNQLPNLPKKFIILDGFLLYWDQDCVQNYDLKFFVRESYEVLKERRRIRQTYHTADGMTWKDPEGYWDQIIWPAYLLAHQHMFQQGEVQTAEIDRESWAGKDTVLLEPTKTDSREEVITRFVDITLESIYHYLLKLPHASTSS